MTQNITPSNTTPYPWTLTPEQQRDAEEHAAARRAAEAERRAFIQARYARDAVLRERKVAEMAAHAAPWRAAQERYGVGSPPLEIWLPAADAAVAALRERWAKEDEGYVTVPEWSEMWS